METGLVFNIQKYSVQDGPGIRTTVFLKGCPLACEWCHNPESQSAARQISFMENRCIRCGQCVQACPVHEKADPALPPNLAGCTLCGECVEACPTTARQMVGRRMTVPEVMAEIEQDRIFYEESGGGVTFSGGEPLTQAAFLKNVLTECRAMGIRTAVDTCGFAPIENLLNIAPVTDLFLFDLKIIDPEKHKRHCGVSSELILSNLRRLDQAHGNIWVRVPLVPGFNDDENNLRAIADFVGELHSVTRTSLLPFHPTARQKYKRLGLPQWLEGVETPTAEMMAAAAGIFRDAGVTVIVGG